MTRVAVIAHRRKSLGGGLPELRRVLAERGIENVRWREVGKSRFAPNTVETAFLYNDRGELIQARLAPGGYEEISRAKLIEPTSTFGSRKFAWAAPAFAHQNVYARNDQELICVSLAANSYQTGKRRK